MEFNVVECNWNWIKRNWAYDIVEMLRRISYRQLEVLLCKQWCLMTKKSSTMKLVVKYYPKINQWMKLMNGKSIRLVLLSCVNECWLGTASNSHLNCPNNSHTYPVSYTKQIIIRTTQVPGVNPGYRSTNSWKCNQLEFKDYQCKHKPSEDWQHL